MTVEPNPDPTPRVLFDAILHPNRSLSPNGFYLLISGVGAISLTVGGAFLAIGAWPIFGFYGLDVLIIYFALRQNYRSGRIYEKVRLTEDTLVVERGDAKGPREVRAFQPYWLKVTMDDPPQHESQVTLSSHGQSVVVGAFLSPGERLEFARALMAELDRLRRLGHPSGLPA